VELSKYAPIPKPELKLLWIALSAYNTELANMKKWQDMLDEIDILWRSGATIK
jgi:hypothetical protein